MNEPKERLRCVCGRVRGKYAHECSKCAKEAQSARLAESRAIVATGECPLCGSALRRNLSMAGWWQCEQLGADTHRARPNDAPCSWQTFTE